MKLDLKLGFISETTLQAVDTSADSCVDNVGKVASQYGRSTLPESLDSTGEVPVNLYTLYSSPNHRDGFVHHTHKDAEVDDEQFIGKTTV